MDLDQDDPFDWSVDQVVQYLCHNSSTPWSTSKNPSPLPDRGPFESALREHGIFGEVLLNGRLDNFFRSVLKLTEGQCYSVEKAIQYAQRKSAKYQDVLAQERLEKAAAMAPFMNGHMPSPFMGSHLPSSFIASPQTTLNPAPAQSNASRPTPLVQSIESAADGDIKMDNQPSPDMQMIQSSTSLKLNGTTGPASKASHQGTPSLGPSSGVHQNEKVHVYEKGRKRRKLEPVVQMPPRKIRVQKQPQASGTWYIGPRKLEPASIFYPIQDDTEDDNWTILPSNSSTGQRLSVKANLLRFFQSPSVKLPPQNGSSRTAVFPYHNEKPNSDKPRFFTLYTSKGGRTIVSMESTTGNDATLQRRPKDHPKEEDQYNYLLQNTPSKTMTMHTLYLGILAPKVTMTQIPGRRWIERKKSWHYEPSPNIFLPKLSMRSSKNASRNFKRNGRPNIYRSLKRGHITFGSMLVETNADIR